MDMKLQHTGEFFFHTRDEIIKNLENKSEYYECSREAEQLCNKVPILMELFKGDNVDQPIDLTKHQRQAIRRFIELRRNMHDMIEREHYYRGQRDCLISLLRCGIFEQR